MSIFKRKKSKSDDITYYPTADGKPLWKRVDLKGYVQVVWDEFGTPSYKGWLGFSYSENQLEDETRSKLFRQNYLALIEHFAAFSVSYDLKATTMDEAVKEYLSAINAYIPQVKALHGDDQRTTFHFNDPLFYSSEDKSADAQVRLWE